MPEETIELVSFHQSVRNNPTTTSLVLGAVSLGAVLLGAVLLGAVSLGAVLLGAVLLGAVSLGAVSLGAVSLGAVSLGAVLLGAVLLGALGSVWNFICYSKRAMSPQRTVKLIGCINHHRCIYYHSQTSPVSQIRDEVK